MRLKDLLTSLHHVAVLDHVSHGAEKTSKVKNVERPQNEEPSTSVQVSNGAENTSKGKNVERSQNEESSSVQVLHTEERNISCDNSKIGEDIISVSDPPVKCFDAKVSLEKDISSFEESTKSNFIILQKSKNFGNEDFKASGNERILWKSPNVKGSILISFTGVPYLIVGRKSLQCHLGRDLNRHKSKKNSGEIKNQTEDHCFRRKRRIIQNTKKMGCTAEIHIIHILRFPDFKVI
ncbi:uncharacterized protein LOC122929296 isoform X2 [Bufo gargarizans]|uniref:uncharacterized protein LOC122929296 isoform X2 n=1 Tax=Bufo gargarizans TaxID=30331 RepID=UPI001CF22BA2|nr:uncharacterized protein LOC122929296 isoform X2 [Bufo gargarizans]